MVENAGLKSDAAQIYGGASAVRQLFANAIRYARERGGISARELADRVGVEESVIHRLESGAEFPATGVVLRALWCLDIALDQVLAAPQISPDQEARWRTTFTERDAFSIAAGDGGTGALSDRASLQLRIRFEALANVCQADEPIDPKIVAMREKYAPLLSALA